MTQEKYLIHHLANHDIEIMKLNMNSIKFDRNLQKNINNLNLGIYFLVI